MMKNLNLKSYTAFFTMFVFALMLGCAPTAKQEGTGEYIDDSVITTKVKAAFVKDPDLSAAEINVETYKGIVQLSGFVKQSTDVGKAGTVARGVKGVKSVKNDLLVR
jgi:osmotically-inducible protein OsmY